MSDVRSRPGRHTTFPEPAPGPTIDALLAECGWTRRELCRRMNTYRSAVYSWRSGHTQMPLDVLDRLAATAEVLRRLWPERHEVVMYTVTHQIGENIQRSVGMTWGDAVQRAAYWAHVSLSTIRRRIKKSEGPCHPVGTPGAVVQVWIEKCVEIHTEKLT